MSRPPTSRIRCRNASAPGASPDVGDRSCQKSIPVGVIAESCDDIGSWVWHEYSCALSAACLWRSHHHFWPPLAVRV